MLKKSAVVLAAGTLAALGITGTALAMDTPSPSAPGPSTSVTVGPSSAAPSSAGSASTGSTTEITEARAREIALGAVPGGVVEDDVERETENGRQIWDVEVQAGATEHDLDIDATTGEILRNDAEQDDDNDDDADDQDDDADDKDDDNDDD
ncbi:PepSY domain-containing protein [Actinoplanes sp. NPDC023714]|uniref:PepSY domain-containing protein n=1 Tax=Actinoplanes sp. NPDC023714 TaxID=3154322 RepID=UPI0033F7EBD2